MSTKQNNFDTIDCGNLGTYDKTPDRQRAIAEAFSVDAPRRSFDTKCYDLAANLLDPAMDTEENRASLAQEIQDAFEDWCLDHPSPLLDEPPTKPMGLPGA